MKILEKKLLKSKNWLLKIKTLLNLIVLISSTLIAGSVWAGVDEVSWSSLESKWRKPICIEESVYPLDMLRAKQQGDELEEKLKKEYSVNRFESLVYSGLITGPDVLDKIRDLVVLRALELARSKDYKARLDAALKRYSKSAYELCSRLLNKYPSTRCHDFLLITIKPIDFVELVGRHFNEYQQSAIYALDMQNHCRGMSTPDRNCSELAKDYFLKNHLESCIAGHLEPPEKISPIVDERSKDAS